MDKYSQSTNEQARYTALASTFRSIIGESTPRLIESDEPSHKLVWDIMNKINAQYEAGIRTSKKVKGARSPQEVKPHTRILI
jgi:hypothetical protein